MPVPVKKGKTPPVKKADTKSRAVRYLLSADRKLQKLSLKRLSARATKPAKPARAAGRSKPAPAVPRSIHVRRALQSPAVLIALIGVVTAATLMAARGSQAPETAPAGAIADVRPPAAAAPVVSAARERVGQTPAPSAAAEARTAASGTAVSAPEPKAAPAATKAAPAVVTPAANDTPRPPVPAAAPPPSAEPEARARTAAEPPSPTGPAPVTITGCVEAARGTFWLKDTSGEDAPKSRSWKSGFLRRSPARIELIDPANRLQPSAYVGQRVAATGVLTDRELRARALRPVAASCN
jgi:hypothetical protein